MRKEKLMALGEYSVVSLAQAREHHFAAGKQLASGVNPMAERKAGSDSENHCRK